MKFTKYLIFLFVLSARIFSAQDGDLDTTFGTNGLVVVQNDFPNSRASGVAVQEDGKIVTCLERGVIGWNVVRFNTNGSLDIQFQTNTIFDNAAASDLAIQSDGKVVVIGTLTEAGVSQFIIARYLPNGNLDTSFNGTGIVTQDFGGQPNSAATAVAIQADGKIVVAGQIRISSTLFMIGLVRYNVNGSFDNLVTTSIVNGNLRTTSLAIQEDQRIVVAGFNVLPGLGNNNLYIARYTDNLVLDPSFNPSGTLPGILVDPTIESASLANGVAIQADGKIVIGGASRDGSTVHLLVARYLSNGDIDSIANDPTNSFGTNGFIAITAGNNPRAQAIAIQSDGKIITSGFGSPMIGSNDNFLLARVLTNGTLDSSFGTAGIVSTDFSTEFPEIIDSRAFAVAIQKNGYIVAAGFVATDTANFIALARYISSPPLFSPTVNQPTNNTTLSGHAENLSFLTIYDVTNPANPIVLCNPVTPENSNPTLTNGDWVCNNLDLVIGQTYNLKLVSRYKTSNVNLASFAQVTIPFPITLAKSGPASILAGSFINYQITLTNNGTDTFSNITIVDQLPEEVTFVSASNGGTFNQANNTVTFNIPSIASGETIILNIRVKSVNLAESRVITNTATSSTGVSATVDTLLIALSCTIPG